MPATDTTAADATVVDPTAAARGTIYGTLAGLFTEPDEQLYEALTDGRLAASLDRLVEQAALGVAVPTAVTSEDYELLCARFNDVFEVGYPDPPVPLYESEYVDDATWDEINLDLARAYDYFGVEVDETEREHHDHLVVELEFAGYLSRLAAATGDDAVRRARRDFLDRHLAAFVAAIAEATAEEVETGVYEDLTSFADDFVRADLRALESDLEEVDAT